MIVTASICEIMEHFGVNGLAEARDRFQSLAASDVPDPASGALGLQRHTFVLNLRTQIIMEKLTIN